MRWCSLARRPTQASGAASSQWSELGRAVPDWTQPANMNSPIWQLRGGTLAWLYKKQTRGGEGKKALLVCGDTDSSVPSVQSDRRRITAPVPPLLIYG